VKELDEKIKNKIIGLINVLLPNAKIYLFGSRARKTNKDNSDIDIALDAGEELPNRIVYEIKSVLNATDIMYLIDVVDINIVDDLMKEQILKDGILWKS
jgi:predicted nucleotidyltransferase